MSALVIYCDGSVRHRERQWVGAGWGAVLVKAGKVVGELRGKLQTRESSVAEFLAARWAFVQALEAGVPSTVIIATDCSTLVEYAEGAVKRQRSDLVAILDKLRKVARERRVTLVFVKVKAHLAGDEPDAVHNRRADRLARIASGGARTDEEIEAARLANHERQRVRATRLKAETRRRHEERQAAERTEAERKRTEERDAMQRRVARAKLLQGSTAW